jgi:NNP family nitrate/nitrite transporter-like MFS transporter
MAGFVLVAVLLRPIGGWMSDRFGSVPVLVGSLAAVVLGAALQASTPALAPLGTITFLSMAAALGAGAGAVFALVAKRSPADMVGGVTGVVGAAGGLGGFIPPLLMGSIYGRSGSYAVGLMLLSLVALFALAYTVTIVRRPVVSPA